MLLISGKEILQEINLKLEETLCEISNNTSDMLSEKDKLLGSYEEQISNQNKKIELLEKENKKLFATTGGLTKSNNKLQQEKTNILYENKDLKDLISSKDKEIKDLKIKLDLYSKEIKEKTKLQGIVEQQEKIISKN